MATTIMISTSVKPDLLERLIFILNFLPFCALLCVGVNSATDGFNHDVYCSLIVCRNRTWNESTAHAKDLPPPCPIKQKSPAARGQAHE